MTAEKQGRTPLRTCCICGVKLPKKQLRRFVWQAGRVVVDREYRRPGRGAYCCDGECEQQFWQSRKKWKRLFRLGI